MATSGLTALEHGSAFMKASREIPALGVLVLCAASEQETEQSTLGVINDWLIEKMESTCKRNS